MGKRIVLITADIIPRPKSPLINYNTGNDLFYLSLFSFLYKFPNVKVMTFSEIIEKTKEDKDYIKRNFDIAISNQANLFKVEFLELIRWHTEITRKLQIPYYVVGLGCQNKVSNRLKRLAPINDAVKEYMDCIHNSGGEVTLRGELTNDYLKSLGYNDVKVLGCPSIYINKLDYEISDNKVSREEFKPLFNAQRIEELNPKLYEDNPKGCFFSQEFYLKALYFPETQYENEVLYNPIFIDMFENNRIMGDINYYPWFRQIVDNNFNFAYGERIHGNIIALHSKVPAFVKVIDSRTREMSEFYNIPNSLEYSFDEKKDSLYDLYKSISYKKYNETYINKFNNFVNYISDITELPINKNIQETNNDFMLYLSGMEYPSYEKNYAQQEGHKKLISYLKEHLAEKYAHKPSLFGRLKKLFQCEKILKGK